jgi:hypothetical protein
MRKFDIWLFRIGAAVVSFVATTFGCRYAGQYLHVQEAQERAHRTRSTEQEREDALYLKDGFSDTEGYNFLSHRLTAAEMTSSYAKPHWLDLNRYKVAGGVALLIAIISGESARLFAVKQDAKRRVSGRYSR